MTRSSKTQTAQSIDAAYGTPEYDAERAEFFGMMFGGLPTGKRMIASFIANVAVCAVGSYAAGCVAAVLGVAAAMLTGSAFLAYCVYFIVMIAGIVASMVVGGKVAKYIATGAIDTDYARAKSWISSKLGRKSPGGELEEDYSTVKAAVKTKSEAAKNAMRNAFARKATA